MRVGGTGQSNNDCYCPRDPLIPAAFSSHVAHLAIGVVHAAAADVECAEAEPAVDLEVVVDGPE